MTDRHDAGGIRPDEVEPLLRGVAAQERLRAEARAAHLARLRSRAEALGPQGADGRRHVVAASSRRATAMPLGRAAAAVVALAVAGVLGTGGIAFAARDALPGDTLYGVKTAVEHVTSLRHTSPEAVVDNRLGRAASRLGEVEALVEGGANGDLIAETFAAHDALLAEALSEAEGDPALEARTEEAAAQAAARIAALLEGDLPAEASDRARAALERVLDRLGAGRDDPRRGPLGDTPAGPRPGAGPPSDVGPPDHAPAHGRDDDDTDPDAPGADAPGRDRQPDTSDAGEEEAAPGGGAPSDTPGAGAGQRPDETGAPDDTPGRP